MKKVLVFSVGGSLIVPKVLDVEFLHKFKQVLRKHYRTHKFVLVCGGGTIARAYISLLKREGKTKKQLSLAGIMATRMNAKLLMQFFGKESNEILPEDMHHIKSALTKNSVVICGALRYTPNSTSDSTAAKLANFLGTEFINLTDVEGLYSDNPKKNPKAEFIPKISWKEFEKIALKIKFTNGQNFVLDQNAAVQIRKEKIPTYILGPDMKNLDNFISGKKFIGTTIRN